MRFKKSTKQVLDMLKYSSYIGRNPTLTTCLSREASMGQVTACEAPKGGTAEQIQEKEEL